MDIEALSASTADAASKAAPIAAFDEEDGPSFSDLLDILNPLQHIPVVSTIYQHLTGDREGAVAEVAGGLLFGGPLGLIGSLVDLAVQSASGKSIGDNVLAWLGLDEEEDSGTALAQSAPAANPASPAAQAAQQTAMTQIAPAVVTLPLAPLRPKASQADLRSEEGDGPQQRGDYLVFGAGAEQPAEPAPLVPAPAQPTLLAAAPRQQGDYLVFGGAPRPAPAAPAPASTPVSAPAAAPAPSTPAGLSPLPARAFAVPERRNQVTPTSLPPPTTGPAAIPGRGPSQAVPLAGDNSWFVNAMAAGLDKYQAAQKLAQSDSATGADSATLH